MAKKSKSLPMWKQVLLWLDENILVVLAGFLLAFIPLYPKIPLYSPIEQYIVRVRLEDFLVFFTLLIWGVQWLRKKVQWQNPITYSMVWYFVVGLLSVLSAIFLIGTVPLQPIHLGKTLLHYFRYIEYFSLFLVFFTAVRSKKQLQILLGVLVATVIAIAAYGYGQKYYYWPVYSTMNREFSKGIRLYLTEHARVQSTFAGHYDLGAYLVIVLPILLALAIAAKKKWLKIILHVAHWSGLYMLVLSASRTSFVAYVVAVSLVIGIYALRQSTWRARIVSGIKRTAFIYLMIVITMLYFGDDLSERLLQVINSNDQVATVYHDWNAKRKDFFNTQLPVFLGLKELPKRKKPEKPEGALSTDEAAQIILKSDTRPTPARPDDVYVDVPDKVKVATKSADGTETIIEIEQPRTYSDNALKHGLSLAIRLDTLWPQAITGFQRNPLVGSGYATLNKEGANIFTEADSTDNNFLRTLGETGLLGFLTFYGSVILAIVIAAISMRSKDELLQTLSIGYIAGSVGLLINALYIDVYAASKVAFTFWSLTGLLLAYVYQVGDSRARLNRWTQFVLGPVAKYLPQSWMTYKQPKK